MEMGDDDNDEEDGAAHLDRREIGELIFQEELSLFFPAGKVRGNWLCTSTEVWFVAVTSAAIQRHSWICPKSLCQQWSWHGKYFSQCARTSLASVDGKSTGRGVWSWVVSVTEDPLPWGDIIEGNHCAMLVRLWKTLYGQWLYLHAFYMQASLQTSCRFLFSFRWKQSFTEACTWTRQNSSHHSIGEDWTQGCTTAHWPILHYFCQRSVTNPVHNGGRQLA